MRLEDIGFYTLSDARARESSESSPLWRCEILLTDACNFRCPYCRGLGDELRGTLLFGDVKYTLDRWFAEGLRNVRFSGGEPTLHRDLPRFIDMCRDAGVERIAVSTNGSASISLYELLASKGVNDFSISLDGCCASVGDKATGTRGAWDRTVRTIQEVSKMTYTTVGMVFTEDNVAQAMDAVMFARSLGVHDVRVIPSAQFNRALTQLADLPPEVLDDYPILRYRIDRLKRGKHTRGIPDGNYDRCCLMLDDMAVAGKWHFPCIIYLREGGDPVGEVGPNMRHERAEFIRRHKPWENPICKEMCLDVCIDYNKKANPPNPIERE